MKTVRALVLSLVTARTTTGTDGRIVPALAHDRLRELLRRYGRLAE
jgi:hypothetical protein